MEKGYGMCRKCRASEPYTAAKCQSHTITHVLLAPLLGGGERGVRVGFSLFIHLFIYLGWGWGWLLEDWELLLNCVAGSCRKIAFNNLKLVVGWASVRWLRRHKICSFLSIITVLLFFFMGFMKYLNKLHFLERCRCSWAKFHPKACVTALDQKLQWWEHKYLPQVRSLVYIVNHSTLQVSPFSH